MRIGAETSAVVGGTPLVLLDRLADGLAGQVCAKLEYFNPGGSVKDRIGVAMIDAAEEEGLVKPGRSVVVEPTSGKLRTPLSERVPPTDTDRLVMQRFNHPTPPRRMAVGRETTAVGPTPGFTLE